MWRVLARISLWVVGDLVELGRRDRGIIDLINTNETKILNDSQGVWQ